MFLGLVEGVWKDSGALEKSSSAALKAKTHWKGSWQILRRGEVGEAYRRDAKCMQKVKRLFSSGRRGRWGGWKSRWWQRGRAEQVPSLKLHPRTTHYWLFWLLLLPFFSSCSGNEKFNSYICPERKASPCTVRMQCGKS